MLSSLLADTLFCLSNPKNGVQTISDNVGKEQKIPLSFPVQKIRWRADAKVWMTDLVDVPLSASP